MDRPRPFAVLVRHFAGAIFKGSGDSEVEINVAGVLGLLAVPGAVLSLALMDKYSSLLRWIRGYKELDPYLTSIPEKQFFILLSMVITGLVVVVRWDRILPGRLDYLNLTPLPIPARQVFLANLAAIALVALIFAVDVNLASGILFPLIVTASQGVFADFVAWTIVHGVVVALASLFAFFSCLAAMGLLMALPYRVFRVVSPWARMAMLIGLVVLLAEGDHWMGPPRWFLGLYQMLQGKATPALAEAGGLALLATAAAIAVALLAYVVSYRRQYRSITETAGETRPRLSLPDGLAPNGFPRAAYFFAMKTLLRSEPHCIVVGALAGLGLLLGRDAWSAPLAFGYLLVCGLRLSFEIPAGLRAVWLFQTTIGEHERPEGVARLVILTLTAVLLGLPMAVLLPGMMGWPLGSFHFFVVLGMCALLTEVVLVGYRKIPFTCPMPEFGGNVTVPFALHVVGFAVFTWGVPRLEQWMFARGVRMVLLPVLAGGAWYVLREWRKAAEDGGGVTFRAGDTGFASVNPFHEGVRGN